MTESFHTNRMKFMNITVDNLTMRETLHCIDNLIRSGKKSYVVTPNVDHIIRVENDEELKQIYDHADLILTDGKPLIWISKLYGTPIREKVSGSDLFPLLCKLCTKRGYRMFFLGAAEGVAAEAARRLTGKYEGLQIAGTYSPPPGFEEDEAELANIIQQINDAKTDVLIVALGCPKQEKFIFRHKEKLHAGLSLGLGASLDFEAGNIKRAPVFMREHGLEWLYRITQDPKRLAKRYLIDDLKIVPLIFKYRKKPV